MSEDGEGATASVAGTSHEDNAAFVSVDGGNTVSQLQSQILELSRKHNAVLSSMTNLGDVQTRPIAPFCGEPSKDVHTVDELIEEVEQANATFSCHR